MNTISLDQITRNILMRRKYPIHYYIDFLIPCKDCLRELSYDENIQTVRYKVLILNDNHAIEIPDDYTDYISVSARVGQYLQPLSETDTLDLIPNYNTSYVIQDYNQGVATDTTSEAGNIAFYSGLLSPYWWTNNWNAFGENTGRQFGGVGAKADTFQINKARNEIKINEDLGVTEVVLAYIGNGLDADAVTQIEPYAQKTIEEYAIWQFKANNRTYSDTEAARAEQLYINERMKLRARLSDLSIDRLKRIIQSNNRGIKY